MCSLFHMLYLFTLRCFVLFILVLGINPLWGNEAAASLQQANALYLKGEQAVTFEQRKQDFNQALSLYHHAEAQMSIIPADLDSAIGDSYFQLGEYPWAILYYQRALKKDQKNHSVIVQLNKSYEKLGFPPAPFPFYTTTQKLLLEPFLSLPQRFELFFWSAFLTLLISSAVIWFPSTWMKKIAGLSTLILCFLLVNVLFSYYFLPLEGVIVSSTGFYREPDINQPQLTNDPLLAGSKVEVLLTTPKGDWLKITDSSGLVGYVPAMSIRII